jgi:hypothetical protein
MTELARERPIMVPAHSHQFCPPAQQHQGFFDPLPLRRARPGRMYQVSQENDLAGRQFVAQGDQFFACARIR